MTPGERHTIKNVPDHTFLLLCTSVSLPPPHEAAKQSRVK
jgi:hypothetical protein